MNKYGFSGGIDLPQTTPERPARRKVDTESLSQAVQAGNEMGFVSREPARRTKPGPKQREAQDKVSIPGPKRVTDAFRTFCRERDLTLWEGLELLLNDREGRG
jgi:hypothetical protein